jgi:hypothetical protein
VNLLATLVYRMLGMVLAIGLMLLQAGYCPMSAKGAACGMAAMPCCQGHHSTDHGQRPGSDNHRAPGGFCMMVCCTIANTMPGTAQYQVHLVRGETHVAWTVPQLESWNTGVILRPPRV